MNAFSAPIDSCLCRNRSHPVPIWSQTLRHGIWYLPRALWSVPRSFVIREALHLHTFRRRYRSARVHNSTFGKISATEGKDLWYIHLLLKSWNYPSISHFPFRCRSHPAAGSFQRQTRNVPYRFGRPRSHQYMSHRHIRCHARETNGVPSSWCCRMTGVAWSNCCLHILVQAYTPSAAGDYHGLRFSWTSFTACWHCFQRNEFPPGISSWFRLRSRNSWGWRRIRHDRYYYPNIQCPLCMDWSDTGIKLNKYIGWRLSLHPKRVKRLMEQMNENIDF